MADAPEQIDFAAVNLDDLHEKYDVDPNIEQYFSVEEVKKMSDYEKNRYRNMKRNYLALNAIGIPYHLPDFMKRKVRERPPPAKWTSSESETEEWKPRGSAQTKPAGQGGARKKTPQQKPRVTRRQRKAKQQAETGATAASVAAAKEAVAAAAAGKRAVAAAAAAPAAARSSSHAFEQGQEDFDLIDPLSEMFPANPPIPPPPPPPPGALDGPRFAGFTKEFSKPRVEALDRAIRHRRRLIDLLEEDMIKMKHLEIVDPIDTGEKEKYDKYGRKIKRAPETNHRYPKRNIGRQNYAKLEVPSDDEFLYCEDCRREHFGECPVHGPLNFIPEISNTLDISLIGTDAYAESTLLPFLCIKKSEVTQDAGYGIFASTKIPKKSVFGPYDGILTKDGLVARENGYSWLIYKDNKPNHYIDGGKKGYSNWMRWVNCACTEEEQNLLAFQLKKEIYYKVIHDIEPKEELLVWYGNEYALEMGLKVALPTKPGCKAASKKDSATAIATAAVDTAIPKGSGARPKQKSVPKGRPAKSTTPGTSRNVASGETCSTKPKAGEDQQKLQSNNLEKTNQISIPILARRAAGTSDSLKGITDETEIDEHITCPDCNFWFLESLIHLHDCTKTINGIEVFQCADCFDMFCDQDYLLRHANKMHGVPFPLEFIKRQMAIKNKRQNQNITIKSCGNISELKGYVADTQYSSISVPCSSDMKGDECIKDVNVVVKEGIAGESKKSDNTQSEKEKNDAVKIKVETQTSEDTGNGLYNCQYCGKGFKNLGNVQPHERTHTGEKPFKCQYCDYRCVSKTDVAKHERTHTGEKPFKCQYCDQRFTMSCNVLKHERRHTGEKPFKCQYCENRFRNKQHAQVHERTHTGEKPYKCQYCDTKFARKDKLQLHERTHTGEKPYKCQYCDKRFTVSFNLRSHAGTHTGVKPYKCPICDRQFAQRQYLTGHLKTHTAQVTQ